MMSQLKMPWILLLALLAVSCDQNSGEYRDSSKVLAKVNGEAITQAQLEANILSLLGEKQSAQLKPQDRRRILDSMVMSRLMSQAAQKDMAEDIKQQFALKAKLYKEKLIVNGYLKSNIDIAPISNKMVEEYYQGHKQEFGQQVLIEYELLTSKQKINEQARNALLAAYSTSKNSKTLTELKGKLAKKGIELQYQKRILKPGVVDQQLESILKRLNKGERSNLSFINGRPYVLGLVDKREQAAAPLSQVAMDIRKKLAPLALKKAIKEKTEKLKSNAKIEYFNKQ